MSEDGKVTLAVNGEIYNHLTLRASLASTVKFKTHSDCEVILPLVRGSRSLFIPLLTRVAHQYKKYDKNVPAFLDGMFAFVLLDESVTPSRIIAARDPVGITTLYQGWSSKRPGATYFASELKALTEECDKIISFPPGHVYDSKDNSTVRYYQPSWFSGDQENAPAPTTSVDLTLIRETLEDAVRKRLMSEVPYGVLLSGGLDSSLIAAIAARETEKVAKAQVEARQRKLANATSGPPTPKWDDRSEQGEESDLSRYIRANRSAEQRCLPVGPSYTHSRSDWNTLPTFWRQRKQRTFWVPLTTSSSLPCRKDWMQFQTSFTILKPTT